MLWRALGNQVEQGGHIQQVDLVAAGSLRDNSDEDPTLSEYHPHGTLGWSADAPIAVAWFPYNRCDVWVCTSCARPFLRYAEFGSY